MWPDDKWAGEARRRPDKEVVIETRKKARQKFLENLPGEEKIKVGMIF